MEEVREETEQKGSRALTCIWEPKGTWRTQLLSSVPWVHCFPSWQWKLKREFYTLCFLLASLYPETFLSKSNLYPDKAKKKIIIIIHNLPGGEKPVKIVRTTGRNWPTDHWFGWFQHTLIFYRSSESKNDEQEFNEQNLISVRKQTFFSRMLLLLLLLSCFSRVWLRATP